MAWSPNEDARLVAGYQEGRTLADLAAVFERPLWAIDQRVRELRDAGVDLPPRKPRWSAERRGDLCRRRREGASLRELQDEFGISRGTLTYHLRVLRRSGEL